MIFRFVNSNSFGNCNCDVYGDVYADCLGICGGEQLINVCLGGTLIQDIKSLSYKTLEHEQTNPRNEVSQNGG